MNYPFFFYQPWPILMALIGCAISIGSLFTCLFFSRLNWRLIGVIRRQERMIASLSIHVMEMHDVKTPDTPEGPHSERPN